MSESRSTSIMLIMLPILARLDSRVGELNDLLMPFGEGARSGLRVGEGASSGLTVFGEERANLGLTVVARGEERASLGLRVGEE